MADVKYEIVERIGVLSESAKGWTMELNRISWNGKEPKYDIRDWSPDHEKVGKGVTFSGEQLERLQDLINNYIFEKKNYGYKEYVDEEEEQYKVSIIIDNGWTRREDMVDLHEKIVVLLLDRIKKDNAVLSYQELCDSLDTQIDAKQIASYLIDLSVWCHVIGAPMISFLVYDTSTNRPDDGFYKLYDKLYNTNTKSEEQKNDVFVNEVNKIKDYDEWDKLERYLGL